MTDSDDKAPVRYLPDGTIEADIDGDVFTLRRPKFGEFRAIREQTNALNSYVRGLPKDRSDEQAQEYEDEILRRRISVLAKSFERLARPLPEDPDDWPAWLILDASVMQRMLNHWQTVPLARG